MTIHSRIIIGGLALFIILLAIYLMKKRSLEVEYGFLWVLCSFLAITIISFDQLLIPITHLTGAIYPTSALTFFSLFLIILVLIFLSTRISVLSIRLKELTQYVALLTSTEEKNDVKKNDSNEFPLS